MRESLRELRCWWRTFLHQVFVRKAKWASTRNEFDSLRMDDILYNWEVSHLCGPSKVRNVVSWSSPSIGVLNLMLIELLGEG